MEPRRGRANRVVDAPSAHRRRHGVAAAAEATWPAGERQAAPSPLGRRRRSTCGHAARAVAGSRLAAAIVRVRGRFERRDGRPAGGHGSRARAARGARPLRHDGAATVSEPAGSAPRGRLRDSGSGAGGGAAAVPRPAVPVQRRRPVAAAARAAASPASSAGAAAARRRHSAGGAAVTAAAAASAGRGSPAPPRRPGYPGGRTARQPPARRDGPTVPTASPSRDRRALRHRDRAEVGQRDGVAVGRRDREALARGRDDAGERHRPGRGRDDDGAGGARRRRCRDAAPRRTDARDRRRTAGRPARAPARSRHLLPVPERARRRPPRAELDA